MAKLLFLVVFVSISQLCSCNDCTYSGYTGDPIFTQKFGDSILVLPKTSDGVQLPSQQRVTAYCPGVFKTLYFSRGPYSGLDEISVKCSNNVITLEMPPDKYRESGHRNNQDGGPNQLNCPARKSEVCQYPVEGCSEASYLHKVTIDGVTIVYAEICHDLRKQHTQFVHYVVAQRSPVLQDCPKYNPGWTGAYMTFDDIGHMADLFNLKDSDKDVQLRSLFGDFSKIVKYESDSLIPKGLFAPYFPEPDFGNWANIYWWTPLKHGNWHMFQNALKDKSKKVDLDIYAGTSHTISFKTAGKCEIEDQIIFNSSSLEKAVPLYVWNYVRQRNSNESIEVVVIGVNSPFTELLDFHSNYTGICVDICETIPWMGRLKYTMRMPALGYIICCHPSEVRDLLEGFPKTVVPTFPRLSIFTTPKPTTTSTSTSTSTSRPSIPFGYNYEVQPVPEEYQEYNDGEYPYGRYL